MSSYLIFVLVLTAVYIIYYAVIVTKDLYGKKDDAKTTEEVFDVSNMADAEESITVEENNRGFSIGGNSYDTQVDAVADYGVGEAANKPNGYNILASDLTEWMEAMSAMKPMLHLENLVIQTKRVLLRN